MTQRITGAILRPVQFHSKQAWAAPSGEGTATSLAGSTGTQDPPIPTSSLRLRGS
jgi:hypothetical protein